MEAPTVKTIPAMTVVCVNHQGPYDQIGEVYQELFAWASSKGVKPAGQPFTLFTSPPSELDWNSARFSVCLPVDASVEGDAKVTRQELPETKVASVTVEGSYDKIPAHYTELLAWMDNDGLEPAGPPREIYHVSPADTDDPKSYRTEIQFPVR